MRTFNAAIAAVSLLFAFGCDAGVGDDGTDLDGGVADGTADAGGSDDATSGGDTGGADAGGSADAGATGPTYESIVIYDGSKTKPATCSGTGPGADIDFVAVYRGGKLLGVGKKGTATYKAGTTTGCDKNEHNDAKAVEGISGGFGDLCRKGGKDVECKDSDLSEGYLSLGGGSVELRFGKCQNADAKTTENKECDGSGDVITLQAGDEIDVHEIGAQYKTKYSMKCVCADEGYEVDIRAKVGVDTGSKFLDGAPGGSKTFKVPAN